MEGWIDCVSSRWGACFLFSYRKSAIYIVPAEKPAEPLLGYLSEACGVLPNTSASYT